MRRPKKTSPVVRKIMTNLQEALLKLQKEEEEEHKNEDKEGEEES